MCLFFTVFSFRLFYVYEHWRAEEAYDGADVGARGVADVERGTPFAGGDGLSNYEHLFRIKAVAANGRAPRHIGHVEESRRDVLFLWIGVFWLSEALKVAD